MLRRKPCPKDERESLPLSEEMRLLAEINALEAQIPGGPWHKLSQNQKTTSLLLGDRKTTLIRIILHEHGEIPVYRNDRWQLFEGK